MQSPRHAGLPDAGQVSEAATPGASVAAVHGDKHAASVLDMPGDGQASAGQASPAQYRSQEGRSSGRRGHGSAGHGQEADAAAPPPAEAAAAGLGPLSVPRLRVQGPDIILEDASSPNDAAAAQFSSSKQAASGAAAGAAGAPAAEAAAAGGAAAANDHAQQLGAAPPAAAQQQQQQQQQLVAPQQHHLVAAARASQSHELELQLRLASRIATSATNPAFSRPLLLSGGEDRARGLEGAHGELGPSSSAPGLPTVEVPVRMKYRSTLTEENVAYLNKLEQYASRPEASVRSSSERIWRWLEGSGPPFDNPPPSLGVPSVTKGTGMAAGSRKQAEKRPGGFLSCFGCFGGGANSAGGR